MFLKMFFRFFMMLAVAIYISYMFECNLGCNIETATQEEPIMQPVLVSPSDIYNWQSTENITGFTQHVKQVCVSHHSWLFSYLYYIPGGNW